MINTIMKKSGEKAYQKDLQRLDYSLLSSQITEKLNISYIQDNSPEHTLDVYYKDDGQSKPIFIDIHGGGFISHDKEVNRLFGNYMAQKGFVVFNLNYKLAFPVYNVFDQIKDVADAVDFILENACEYNGNLEKLYIAGHSSSGVLAVAEALLCVSPKMRADFNIPERSFKYSGVLLECGLMHFYKKSIAYWGMRNMVFPTGYKNESRYKDLIFENNPDISKLPKTVLLTNSKDELNAMTYHFKQVLSNYNVENKLIDKGSDGHMGIIFKPYTKENIRIIDEITNFLGLPFSQI